MKFSNVFSIEVRKYARSFILPLVIIVPVLVAGLNGLNFLYFDESIMQQGRWTADWFAKTVRAVWGIFLYPFLIAAVITLSWMIELPNLKLLFSTLLQRWQFLVAKYLFFITLAVITSLTLTAAILGIVLALGLPLHHVELTLLGLSVGGVLGILPVVAVQLLVVVISESLLISLGVAAVGQFIGLMTFGHSIGQYWPWSYPIALLGANGQTAIDLPYVAAGLATAFLIGLITIRLFARRDIT